ncbi:MAG TPA: hypothetical protein VMT66_14980 [Steroidobacteraceae bacterium]|nr:hypothetical protein [Steroidobacteraceae bacterium]
MVTSMTKRVLTRTVGLAASLGLIALAAAAQASAACMSPKGTVSPMAGAAVSADHLVPAVYRPGATSGADFLAVGDFDDDVSIVGLWQFKMAGFSVDWGTQAWHADGTEIMFSGGQNPETGDVCQGVWRKVGRSTYTLNHIAMGWLAPGAGFGLRVHIHMIVNLNASGNSFSGSYKAAVYSVSPANPFDESVQVASGTGTVTGSRVKPD